LEVAMQTFKVPKMDGIVMPMAAFRPWKLPCKHLRYQN
jgi:hypothetical protein